MENKSRVILYENLRKKIANMDVYSFSEQEDVAKNLPPRTGETNEEEVSSTGIKKNTLSVSIDRLMDENENYQQRQKEEELKTRYQEKVHQQKHGISKLQVILAVVIPAVVIAAVFVILFATGVL